jgi:hypothetical protein
LTFFRWLRAFRSPDERDRVKSAFYDGPAWKDELEAVVMPMLESYAAVVTQVPDLFINFDGSKTKGLNISSLNLAS